VDAGRKVRSGGSENSLGGLPDGHESALPGLEKRPRQARLTDDRAERAGLPFVVGWNRNGDGGVFGASLHDDMTAPTTHLGEAMLVQDAADFAA